MTVVMWLVGVVIPEVPVVREVTGGLANEVAGAALDVTFDLLLQLVAGAVEAVTVELIEAMEASSSIDLATGVGGLSPIREVVLGLSLALLLAMFFVNVFRALMAGEPGPVIRGLVVDVPAAMALTTLYVAVADIVVRITDLASVAVLGDVAAAVGKVAAALSVLNMVAAPAGGPPAAGLLTVFFALLYVFAALMVWAELLVRSALIYVIVVLAPLGYATRASAGSQQVARRTTEILFAVIISKFGIAVAFAVGATLIDGATTFGDPAGAGGEIDVSAMFIGCTVVLLAAFMPWMILRAIPIMEAAVVSQGAERGPLRFAAATAGLAIGAASLSRLAGTKPGSGPPPPPTSSPPPGPPQPLPPAPRPGLNRGQTPAGILDHGGPQPPTLGPGGSPPPALPGAGPRWPGLPPAPTPVPGHPPDDGGAAPAARRAEADLVLASPPRGRRPAIEVVPVGSTRPLAPVGLGPCPLPPSSSADTGTGPRPGALPLGAQRAAGGER